MINQVLVYRNSPSAGTKLDRTQFRDYLSAIGSPFINNTKQAYMVGTAVPLDVRLGAQLWHFWLKTDVVTNVTGLENIFNVLKVTKAFLDTENHKAEVKDEQGDVIEQIPVSNREFFKPIRENATHGLIRLTADNYQLLEGKFQYQTVTKYEETYNNIPTAIYSEKKYLEMIAEGGDFYVPPTEIIE